MTLDLSEGLLSAGLEIDRRDGEIWAVLVFKNEGVQTEWLDPVNGCLAGYVDNEVFVIRNENDERIHYCGPLAYREPLALDDYVALPPGATRKVEVRIDEVYEFPEKGRVSIHYGAYHGDADKGGLVLVRSNDVEISIES